MCTGPCFYIYISVYKQCDNEKVIAYRCWTKDCISLAALAELAKLIFTKRVCGAILWKERLASENTAAVVYRKGQKNHDSSCYWYCYYYFCYYYYCWYY